MNVNVIFYLFLGKWNLLPGPLSPRSLRLVPALAASSDPHPLQEPTSLKVRGPGASPYLSLPDPSNTAASLLVRAPSPGLAHFKHHPLIPPLVPSSFRLLPRVATPDPLLPAVLPGPPPPRQLQSPQLLFGPAHTPSLSEGPAPSRTPPLGTFSP